MARADEIFAGNTMTVEDDRMAYGEKRFITIGLLEKRMMVLVWTPRGAARLDFGAERPVQAPVGKVKELFMLAYWFEQALRADSRPHAPHFSPENPPKIRPLPQHFFFPSIPQTPLL